MNNAYKPAYPIGQEMFDEMEMGRQSIDEGYGLTKRERFAMAAMQGFCANPKYDDETITVIADLAISQADIILDMMEETQ